MWIPNLTLKIVKHLINAGGQTFDAVVNPYGSKPYHSVDHMVSVSRNAVYLAGKESISNIDCTLLAVAGLFHDAGRLDIEDSLNIRKAIDIASNWIPDIWIGKVARYIAATEYSPERTEYLIQYGTVEERIMRDADFLAWAVPERKRKKLYLALAEESGHPVNEESTKIFLHERGCFSVHAQERFAHFGFDVPLIVSEPDKSA